MVAAVDPDPRVDGKGIARLRAAGMAVEVGCLEAQACRLNGGFFRRMRQRRPFVALKLATSADGRIATASGDSQWITGAEARAEGHRLRLRHDAIMIGSGTALADDPMLDLQAARARAPLARPGGPGPPAAAAGRRAGWRGARRISRCGCSRPWWTAGRAAHCEPRASRCSRSTSRIPTAELHHILATLAEQGITRVLVEGGATLATAFLRAGLVDRLYQFAAPMLIGADGYPATHSLAVERLADARRWRRVDARMLGSDRLDVLEPIAQAE